MKIGIMGGTFNPIHNGHLLMAEQAWKEYDLHEIWFMPNGNPPHKPQTENICASFREEMVALAIEGREGFRLEEYESDRKEISYTYQTMEYFTSRYPEYEFYYMIGADSLFSLESWRYPERIFSSCILLAACRDKQDRPELLEKEIARLRALYGADIRILHMPLVDISSRLIRERIQKDISVSDLVPKPVENYIHTHHLYKKQKVGRK